jgi:hypothetical protein
MRLILVLPFSVHLDIPSSFVHHKNNLRVWVISHMKWCEFMNKRLKLLSHHKKCAIHACAVSRQPLNTEARIRSYTSPMWDMWLKKLTFWQVFLPIHCFSSANIIPLVLHTQNLLHLPLMLLSLSNRRRPLIKHFRLLCMAPVRTVVSEQWCQSTTNRVISIMKHFKKNVPGERSILTATTRLPSTTSDANWTADASMRSYLRNHASAACKLCLK